MYSLRRISGAGVQMNQVIGDNYTLIHREWNPEEFKRSFKVHFEVDHVADGDPTSTNDSKMVYAFIGNGTFLQPLYKNQKNYVMSSNGNTFDNVTYK